MGQYKKALVGLFVLLGAFVLWWYLASRTQAISARLLEAIGRSGPGAPVVFGAAYLLACLLSLPGSVLTLAGGFLFGAFWGTVIVSVSSTLGATASFCAARYLLRRYVARWSARYPTIFALDEAIAADGLKTVLLLRLSPLVPFNAFNYLMGVTRVSLGSYVAGSWLGMLPGTLMYVCAGSLVRDLGRGAVRHKGGSVWSLGLTMIGFAATVYVTIVVTARARRSLASRQARPTAPTEAAS